MRTTLTPAQTLSKVGSILSSIDSELVGAYESGFYHPIDLQRLVAHSTFIIDPEEGGDGEPSEEQVLDLIRALSNSIRDLQMEAMRAEWASHPSP